MLEQKGVGDFMTDPGAEMKARAGQDYCDWFTNEDDHRQPPDVMAAFAAKEVARAEALLMRYKRALEGLTPGGSEFVDDPERCAEHARKRQDSLWEQFKKQKLRTDETVARAVEEERMANIKAICVYCNFSEMWEPAQKLSIGTWEHESKEGDIEECLSAAIHERSQVKGEG
jgi:hypothetical protein